MNDDVNNGDDFKPNKSLAKALERLNKLIEGLRKIDLPKDLANDVNAEVEDVYNLTANERKMKRRARKAYNNITKWVQKETGMVPPGYYRNMWMALGMSVFGVPFGVAFSSALSNFAFIGVGIPIGMAIGIAIGTKKDEEAKASGKQLEI